MRDLFGWPLDLFRFFWEVISVMAAGFVGGLGWTVRLTISAILGLKNIPAAVVEASTSKDDILFGVYILVLGLFMVSTVLAKPGSFVQGLCLTEVVIAFLLLALATARRITQKS
jgi:hypothetical protein